MSDTTAIALDQTEEVKARQDARRNDLTQGSVPLRLTLFAIPLVGSMFAQSLGGAAKLFWVSHILGESALAANSATAQLLLLMLAFVVGLSIPAGILIAQAVGRRDHEATKRVFWTAVFVFIILSAVVSGLGATQAHVILSLLNTPPDIAAFAAPYMRLTFLAVPPLCLLVLLTTAQRAVGDSRRPFICSLLAVVLDLILCPVFIKGVGPIPHLGLLGAGLSTLISQTAGLLTLIWWCRKVSSPVAIFARDWKLLRAEPTTAAIILAKGAPIALQSVITLLAGIVTLKLVNQLGTTSVAAYSASLQVYAYAQMPSAALGSAVTTMTSQYIGANRFDRVGRIAASGAIITIISTGLLLGLIYHWNIQILRIFLPAGGSSLPVAAHINVWILWGCIPLALSWVIVGVVRSTGAVWVPFLCMACSLWIVRTPLAVFLPEAFGPLAIWISLPVGSTAGLAFLIIYYKRGNWQKSKMSPSSELASTSA